MSKKANFYLGKALVTSVAAAALGVVALNTQDVKADQTTDQSVNTAKLKQTANNIVPVANTTNGADDNLSKQIGSETNEKVQPPINDNQPAQPKKTIKTVADLPNWESTDGKASNVTLTLTDDNQELDISGGTITDPRPLFWVCFQNGRIELITKLKKIKITGNLTITGNASYLFGGLGALTQIEGLEKLDTSGVTSMSSMFEECSSLTSLDASHFDTSKVTDMSSMFSNCSSLYNLDLTNFNTKHVVMGAMFANCAALNTLKLGTEFVNSSNKYLPTSGSAGYWKWYKIGKGTSVHPEDQDEHSSNFFDNFDGSKNAGTYVRLDSENSTRAKDIIIHYLDKSSNNKIKDETCEGLLGEKFIPKQEITDNNGRRYFLTNDNRNSQNVIFIDPYNGEQVQPKEFSFYYTKENIPNAGSSIQNVQGGDVTVHYQDEQGNTLAPDEILKGHLGEGYTSQEKKITGYSLKLRPEKATGFFENNPQSITYVYTLDQAKISKKLMHNAFIYDINHHRVGNSKFHSYENIMVYPETVRLTDGVLAYKLADNQYVLAANIDGTLRQLKHNSYVYQTGRKRANHRLLRKGRYIRTYGAAYKFKNGKLYYRIGGPKKQYVKVRNFK
ncbi:MULTISPECIES: MucBP domain-containing protein [unclassified Lactobacillus]|uniref:SLAP domain-containing protein n=1 Tax=unclassified Lactobacillus TaxID=2620435 RepID=UPI000EFC2D50|nr:MULTISPECIES: MucBP domain-containing protein [unclassified Lactobacillus]RMC23748.1 BspA family leucine-rich repeat surface protein [Lactobacillus sp. ESL0247]RMC27508.1 BspA family leucine-rich repeat surface protein [Lactobacillus sp. ESL0246]RMC30709.1 BspA family leucine-rich repeat surface protein [Lactobacillus sp. ESL0245]